MSFGLFLGVILFTGLACWGLLDLAAWLTGRETFSQWIIKQGTLSKVFAIEVFLIIVLGASWLIVHFELPQLITRQFTPKPKIEVYEGQYVLEKRIAAAWCGDTDECQEEHEGKTYLVESAGESEAIIRQEGERRIVEYDEKKDLCKTEFQDAQFCEPNYVIRAYNDLGDPLRSQQWGLDYIGAADAWKVISKAEKITIAVVDTGTMCDHEDLLCSDQYDAISDKPYQQDGAGHGTHCSSVACGLGDNGEGTTGTVWGCRLAAYKFLDANGSGGSFEAARAIDRAVAAGADIISASWGSAYSSRTLASAIERAQGQGVIIVAAAGNDGTSNDDTPHYPSNYSGVIAVGSIQSDGGVSSFSNYGRESVAIGAPGSSILAAWNNGAYRSISGTSMATPFVSGVLAAILAKDGSQPRTVARAERAIQTLFDSAKKEHLDKFKYGVLDYSKALGEPEPTSTPVSSCKPKKCKRCKKLCRTRCQSENGCNNKCKGGRSE